MTRQEAIKWLSNLKMDIGKPQHQELWYYEQAIDEIIEALEQETVLRETYTHEYCLRKDFEMKVFELEKKIAEQEPKRGKWVAIDDTHSQCMECGAIFCITSSNEWEVNYCPNCGAKME